VLALIAVGDEGIGRAKELTDAPVGALTAFE
jgi:adenine phosphoribosyltransferase